MTLAEGELPVSRLKLLSSFGLAALMSLLPVAPAAAQSVTFTADVGAACTSLYGATGGVAVDPHSGNIVVTTPDFTGQTTPTVCILGPGGNLIAILTQSDGVTPFPFQTPIGVAIDPDSGAIVVADAGIFEVPNSGSVTVFSAAGVNSGALTTSLGSDLGFDTPTGVAIDASRTATRGQVVVADPSLNAEPPVPALRVFNAINPGDASATANGGTPGSEQIEDIFVDGPVGLAIDANGNVWVADVFDATVYEVSSTLTNQAFLTIDNEPGGIELPFVTSLSFDPVFGNLAIGTFLEEEVPVLLIVSPPGPVFAGTAVIARRNIAQLAPAALAGHVPQHGSHPAATGRTARGRFAAAAARRWSKGARPDCGCEPLNFVNTTPLVFTTGDVYENFSLGFNSTQGGQEFFAIAAPDALPVLFPVAYVSPNTLLVGDESGNPLQEFTLAGVDVPTLGGIAALGFAGLLGIAALARVRRAR